MTQALDTAFKISHYVGKLFDISTNPDIAKGTDYAEIAVPEYARLTCQMLSGDVPSTIAELFDVAASIGGNADPEVRTSLTKSFGALNKIVALTEPATGPSASFTQLQSALADEMVGINAAALAMKL